MSLTHPSGSLFAYAVEDDPQMAKEAQRRLMANMNMGMNMALPMTSAARPAIPVPPAPHGIFSPAGSFPSVTTDLVHILGPPDAHGNVSVMRPSMHEDPRLEAMRVMQQVGLRDDPLATNPQLYVSPQTGSALTIDQHYSMPWMVSDPTMYKTDGPTSFVESGNVVRLAEIISQQQHQQSHQQPPQHQQSQPQPLPQPSAKETVGQALVAPTQQSGPAASPPSTGTAQQPHQHQQFPVGQAFQYPVPPVHSLLPSPALFPFPPDPIANGFMKMPPTPFLQYGGGTACASSSAHPLAPPLNQTLAGVEAGHNNLQTVISTLLNPHLSVVTTLSQDCAGSNAVLSARTLPTMPTTSSSLSSPILAKIVQENPHALNPDLCAFSPRSAFPAVAALPARSADAVGVDLPIAKPVVLPLSSSSSSAVPACTPVDAAEVSEASRFTVFKCTYPACQQTRRSLLSLDRHVKKHTEEAKFAVCVQCSRKFTCTAALERHARCHSGDKPYFCRWKSCGRRFADVSNLKRHELAHIGCKPYVCTQPECGRAFTRRSTLKAHLISVHSFRSDDPKLTRTLARRTRTTNELLRFDELVTKSEQPQLTPVVSARPALPQAPFHHSTVPHVPELTHLPPAELNST